MINGFALLAFELVYGPFESYSHTHTNTLMEQPSSAIWGSVSCPKLLGHAAVGSWDLTTVKWQTCFTS